MISNCGSDENGKGRGGVAGDQTGNEWNIIGWYVSKPGWNFILRHPREDVRELLAELATRAARNDNIGYDMGQRTTFWEQLQLVGYDPSRIYEPCETDCSNGVISLVKSVGFLLKIPELQNINATYTGNMAVAFKAAGFQLLTDSRYLDSPDYLLRGDILLRHDSATEDGHTATNLDDGKYADRSATAKEVPAAIGGNTAPVTRDWLQRGDVGQRVKNAQALLYAHGYLLNADGENDWREIDGEFGNRTYLATVKFQSDHGLEPDGEIGPITLAALNS